MSDSQVYDDAVTSTDDLAPQTGPAQVDALTSQTSPEALLAALDPQQREVASTLEGPVAVLAGAGTGKTRAITHRMAYGVRTGSYNPTNVMALTYTARAAGEMRSRLRDLGAHGVSARTFHAAAMRQLQYFWPQAYGGSMPPLIKAKAKLIAQAASSVGVGTGRDVVRDLATEIEWCKVSMLPADKYAVAAEKLGREGAAGVSAIAIARVMVAYEQLKTEERAIDFEDVLLMCASMMESRNDIADQVRRQYRHFVVDEYQDISAVQHHLMRQWLGDRRDVCVVGDAGQTVYSFAGANPSYLIDFAREFDQARYIRLTTNYRCTPNIVRLANAILGGAPKQYQRGYVELTSPKEPAAAPRVVTLANDVEEADWVAAEIAQLIGRGKRPEDIAVLYRINAQSEAFEQSLASKNIPFVLRGGERFFAREEIRQAMVLLRGAAAGGQAGDLANDVRAVLASAGWKPEPPSQMGAVRSRWESLQALVALADHLVQARPASSMADMVKELNDRAEAQNAPTVSGVTLASLHATKGLEWDVVFVCGASDGMIPFSMADSPAEVEEERRLLYVGCTRAREDLILTMGLNRGGSTSGRQRSLSRFLAGRDALVKAKSSRLASQNQKTRRVQKCRVCGEPLGTRASQALGRCQSCPSSYDENVFEALKQWRTEEAQAASVPAFVVLHDATLVAIAERMPLSHKELLSIPGIGAVKADKYGGRVLDVVKQATAGADQG